MYSPTHSGNSMTPFSIITCFSILTSFFFAVANASDLSAMEILPRQRPAGSGGAQAGQVLISNLQPFSGALGGFSAPSISQSQDNKRPFQVAKDTFTDFQSAADRACDNQKNACADAANKGSNKAFSVSECDAQNEKCKTAAKSAKDTNFATFTFADADNEYFCEQ